MHSLLSNPKLLFLTNPSTSKFYQWQQATITTITAITKYSQSSEFERLLIAVRLSERERDLDNTDKIRERERERENRGDEKRERYKA